MTATANIEELDLPRSNLMRVCKAAVRLSITEVTAADVYAGQLPDGVMVQKDAKMALAKAATTFINYLTATCALHCIDG